LIKAGELVCTLWFHEIAPCSVRPRVGRPISEVSMPRMRKFCPLVFVEQIADHAGIEERDLNVVPVFLIEGAVPLQTMIEELRFPP